MSVAGSGDPTEPRMVRSREERRRLLAEMERKGILERIDPAECGGYEMWRLVPVRDDAEGRG